MCTPEKIECVFNISTPENTKCFKKCSGLLVTTFDKYEMTQQSKQFISKLTNDYWKYKGFYNFPWTFQSKEGTSEQLYLIF